MIINEKFSILMSTGANQLNMSVGKEEVSLFQEYMNLLLQWNNKVNLTAITEMEDIVIKHFLDSLVIFTKMDIPEQASVIDVGTGAGFPGLPMKILRPDLRVVLLDSLQKRINFLEDVIGNLNLSGIEAIHGRAEEAGRSLEYRERFDLAVARAVAKLPVLIELNLPFVKVGGHFIALKGPDSVEEIQNSSKALQELGAEIVREDEIQLPFTGDRRILVIIRKVRPTSEKYPRRPGLPNKKPLT